MLEKKKKKERNSFSLKYLRPTVRARLLDVLLFLLPPSHEGAATKTMNKYHISIDTGAKKKNKARESESLLTAIVSKFVQNNISHLREPPLGMKQVNAVLVTLVLAEVSIQIGKSSDSMTKQGHVLKQNDTGRTMRSL